MLHINVINLLENHEILHFFYKNTLCDEISNSPMRYKVFNGISLEYYAHLNKLVVKYIMSKEEQLIKVITSLICNFYGVAAENIALNQHVYIFLKHSN